MPTVAQNAGFLIKKPFSNHLVHPQSAIDVEKGPRSETQSPQNPKLGQLIRAYEKSQLSKLSALSDTELFALLLDGQ